MAMITPGDFRFLANKWSTDELDDAYKAVTIAECWDWLAHPDVPTHGEGFMFNRSPELEKITNNMKLNDNHSGASFASVMRVMEFIAKHGWETFVNEFRPIE
jgi:hypothetical protein